MAAPGSEVQEAVVEIPLQAIRPNPHQPRRRFDETALKELAASIKVSGLLEPVIVRYGQQEGEFELVVGERRLRACKLLEAATIPAIVRDYSAEESRELVLVENLQREDLNPMEEARALEGLLELYGDNVVQVADQMGKTEQHVRNRVGLLTLPDAVQQMVEDGVLNVGQAEAIVELGDEKKQLAAAKKAYQLRFTPAQIRGSMQEKKGNPSPSAGQRGGVVRSATLMQLIPKTYDAIEGFEFVKLKDAAKRMALKRQLQSLHEKLGEVLQQFGEG